MKKKGLKYIVYLAIFLIIVACIDIFLIPKELKRSVNGISYSRQNENHEKKVNVIFHGYVNKNLLKNDTFEGKIIIDDTEYPNVYVNLNTFNGSPIDYINDGELQVLGTLYANKKLDQFVIQLYEDKGNGCYVSGNRFICGPSFDRKEAIKLTELLLRRN